MSFSLYCLIENVDHNYDINSLASQFQKYFSRTQDFRQEFEENPFNSEDKNLLLFFGVWWIRVFFEVGNNVKKDSEFISDFADNDKKELISKIDRRVRVIFADDDDMSHTNHIIFMMEFLQSLDGMIIFDPQQNKIVED